MILPGLIGQHVAFVGYDEVSSNRESIYTSGLFYMFSICDVMAIFLSG
jgi:hypothetical protein